MVFFFFISQKCNEHLKERTIIIMMNTVCFNFTENIVSKFELNLFLSQFQILKKKCTIYTIIA